jgi:hypothetical protein
MYYLELQFKRKKLAKKVNRFYHTPGPIQLMFSTEETCDGHKKKTVKFKCVLLRGRDKYKPMDIRERIILKWFINT